MKILMSKTLSGQLKPCYDSDAELLKKIKAGDEVECEIKRPRNLKFHKKLFSLLNLVYSNQELYKDINDLRKDLTIAAGYSFHLRPLINEIRAAGMLVEEGKVMGAMDVVDFLNDGTSISELQNMIFACPTFVFDTSNASTKASDFRKLFNSKFGKNPSYVPAYAFDNAWAIVKAYHEFGKVSVKGIRDTLPLMGVTGKIKLDNDGDIEATIDIARIGKNNMIEKINNDQASSLINKQSGKTKGTP